MVVPKFNVKRLTFKVDLCGVFFFFFLTIQIKSSACLGFNLCFKLSLNLKMDFLKPGSGGRAEALKLTPAAP